MVCWRAKDLRQLLSIVPRKALVVGLPQLVRSLLPTLPFLMGKSHDKVMEPNVKIQTLTSALRLLALIRLMFDIFSVSEACFDLERKYLCFERTTSTINSVVAAIFSFRRCFFTFGTTNPYIVSSCSRKDAYGLICSLRSPVLARKSNSSCTVQNRISIRSIYSFTLPARRNYFSVALNIGLR